jgi:hypothetical protein
VDPDDLVVSQDNLVMVEDENEAGAVELSAILRTSVNSRCSRGSRGTNENTTGSLCSGGGVATGSDNQEQRTDTDTQAATEEAEPAQAPSSRPKTYSPEHIQNGQAGMDMDTDMDTDTNTDVASEMKRLQDLQLQMMADVKANERGGGSQRRRSKTTLW